MASSISALWKLDETIQELNEAIQLRFVAKYVIVRNVCVMTSNVTTAERGKNKPVIHLESFDPTLESQEFKFKIRTRHGPKYSWIMRNNVVHSDVRTFHNQTAVFAGFWNDYRNIYSHMHKSIPTAYDQIRFVNESLPNERLKPPAYFIIPSTILVMTQFFGDVFLNLGYRQILQAPDITARNEDTCFKYALLPKNLPGDAGYVSRERIKETFRFLETRWMKEMNVSSSSQCQSNYALILQRKTTRRIDRVTSLASAIRSAGYNDVRVTSLENKSFAEQWNTVRCASLFAGVQGAGLMWYFFLPPNATFIEITYDGWHYFYSRYASSYRPDLKRYSIQCQRVTPDHVWQDYAQRWFNYTGEITDNWKKTLDKKSKEVKARARYSPTVWKDSDCFCSSETVKNALLAR